MEARRWVTPTIYAGLALTALVVAWLALPSRPEAPAPPEPVAVEPERPRPAAPAQPVRKSEAVARTSAPMRIARADRSVEAASVGDDVDRLAADREAGVAVRRAEVEQTVGEIAASRGWDSQTTAEVQGILLETLEGAESKLAEVHDADAWSRMRLYYSRHRQLQAKRVKSVLGDEEFAAFMEAKSFPRIPSTTGQQPIRWFPYKLRDDDD